MIRKVYRLGEASLHARLRDLAAPQHELRNLFWECTLSCNANCKHCGSDAQRRRYDDELSTDEITAAFKDIAHSMDAREVMVSVTGGEPMLRPDLGEVMGLARSLGFSWGMTTNGTLLDDDGVALLKESGLSTISVSIDGMRETHDSFRGLPGSFDCIGDNIKRLRAAGFVRHLQVTTVFHKHNIAELDDLYALLCTYGLDSWRVTALDPIGRAGDHADLLLDGADLKRLLDFVKLKRRHGPLPLRY
ncbi:MAG: radical SAM protein, partial [Coriobacteriales bacterium]|nr:radical SAM protein [Coriobacteriales bacterium]